MQTKIQLIKERGLVSWCVAYQLYANDKSTKDVPLAIFVDLSKAFDAIDHATLLHKLQLYGTRETGNVWIANCLYNHNNT